MSIHLSKRQVERYLKKSMSPVELLEIDEHVSTCKDCHAQLYGPDAVLRAYISIASELNKDASEINALRSGLQSSKTVIAKPPESKQPLRSRAFLYATAMVAVVFIAVWISFKYIGNGQPSDQHDKASIDNKVSEPADSQNLSSDNQNKQEERPAESAAQSVRERDSESLASKYRDMIEDARAGKLIISPILQKLHGRAGNLMNDSAQEVSSLQTYPVGEVIEAVRPVFRWEPLKGASGYVITVFDPSYNEVAKSESVEATAWTMPRALERGVIYSWTLSATKDGQIIRMPAPSQPESKFKILGRSEAEELKRVKKKYPSDHLLLGALYARAGLLNKAELEFSNLLKTETDSHIARKLLERVRGAKRKAR